LDFCKDRGVNVVGVGDEVVDDVGEDATGKREAFGITGKREKFLQQAVDHFCKDIDGSWR
jgi:hypothetical protein